MRFEFGRRESQSGEAVRAGAGGQAVKFAVAKAVAWQNARIEVYVTDEVGRGVGQGYFACQAGGVGSIPTWIERSSSSLEERLGP